jgi:hypothetical protein
MSRARGAIHGRAIISQSRTRRRAATLILRAAKSPTADQKSSAIQPMRGASWTAPGQKSSGSCMGVRLYDPR